MYFVHNILYEPSIIKHARFVHLIDTYTLFVTNTGVICELKSTCITLLCSFRLTTTLEDQRQGVVK